MKTLGLLATGRVALPACERTRCHLRSGNRAKDAGPFGIGLSLFVIGVAASCMALPMLLVLFSELGAEPEQRLDVAGFAALKTFLFSAYIFCVFWYFRGGARSGKSRE